MNSNFKLLALVAGSALTIGALPPAMANDQGSGSATAAVPALSPGMIAPTLNVGSVKVEKGTVQYSNSVGSNDSFSVGANTNIGASVNASSTPDYSVTSNATFGVAASTINQKIGTANSKTSSTNNTISNIEETGDSLATVEVEKDFQKDTTSGGYWWWNRRNNKRTKITENELTTTKEQYKKDIKKDIMETLTTDNSSSGTISGSFTKAFSTTGSSNEVTVNGIGTDANVVAASGTMVDGSLVDGSAFKSKIEKAPTTLVDGENPLNSGAGTASGGASGSVGTTATANSSSTQFVSSFGQAY